MPLSLSIIDFRAASFLSPDLLISDFATRRRFHFLRFRQILRLLPLSRIMITRGAFAGDSAFYC